MHGDGQRSAARPGRRDFRVRTILTLGVLTVAGAALGGYVGSSVPVTATAESTILLNPLEGNAFYPGGAGEDLVHLVTEAQLLRSDAVAQDVAVRTASTTDPRALLEGLAVSVPANTQILTIEYEHPQDGVALTMAQAFAESYLDYRRQRAEKLLSEQRERLTAETVDREAELSELSADFAGAETGSPQSRLLSTQIDAVSTQITQLKSRLTDLAATSLDPGQVVTPARLEAAGLLSPRMLGSGAGGMLVLLVALGISYLRRGNLTSDGVEVLGTLEPGVPSGDPWSPEQVTEVHRLLRAKFLRVLPPGSQSVCLLIPATTAQSHAVAAVPLAVSLGLSGLRTVVVDVTGLLPLPHGVVGSRDARGSVRGLSEILRGEATHRQVMVETAEHVDLIPGGTAADEVHDLLAGRHMTDLLDELRADADVVLLVGHPISTVSSQTLASVVRGVVVEVHGRSTDRAELTSVREACEELPCEMLGVVMVSGPGEHHAAHRRAFSRRRHTEAPVPRPAAKASTGTETQPVGTDDDGPGTARDEEPATAHDDESSDADLSERARTGRTVPRVAGHRTRPPAGDAAPSRPAARVRYAGRMLAGATRSTGGPDRE